MGVFTTVNIVDMPEGAIERFKEEQPSGEGIRTQTSKDGNVTVIMFLKGKDAGRFVLWLAKSGYMYKDKTQTWHRVEE